MVKIIKIILTKFKPKCVSEMIKEVIIFIYKPFIFKKNGIECIILNYIITPFKVSI